MSTEFQTIEDQNSTLQLITIKAPRSALAESYRTLRANLGFVGLERPFRTIMVTSSSAKDGKSTVVSNLAVVTAQAGHKVLLVDCDLRKPVQHKLFQLPNHSGFTTCILTQGEPEQATQATIVDNLKVLTSGPIPPNPAEILDGERTRLMWTRLLSYHDYVFIDSPPVLEVADASIIASQLDAVLLVLRYGVTRMEIARQVQDQLARANARVIGAVINQVKTGADQYYEYGY
jgi:capsular exopolysaccharide synthesis family protein